mgnify:CR=1 FL=1
MKCEIEMRPALPHLPLNLYTYLNSKLWWPNFGCSLTRYNSRKHDFLSENFAHHATEWYAMPFLMHYWQKSSTFKDLLLWHPWLLNIYKIGISCKIELINMWSSLTTNDTTRSKNPAWGLDTTTNFHSWNICSVDLYKWATHITRTAFQEKMHLYWQCARGWAWVTFIDQKM